MNGYFNGPTRCTSCGCHQAVEGPLYTTSKQIESNRSDRRMKTVLRVVHRSSGKKSTPHTRMHTAAVAAQYRDNSEKCTAPQADASKARPEGKSVQLGAGRRAAATWRRSNAKQQHPNRAADTRFQRGYISRWRTLTIPAHHEATMKVSISRRPHMQATNRMPYGGRRTPFIYDTFDHVSRGST